MSQDRDLDTTVTVTRGDVTVEKRFEPDEFPVPVISFDIDSASSEAIDIRLVDHVPEEFPMSAIGFHPDFESDNWSAYKDHRVVFERTLEPDEELRTVYGVRLDREEDAVAFLDEPTLEGVGDVDESVADLLGEDRNQEVRDVLAGERDTLVTDDPDESELDLEEPSDETDPDDTTPPSPRTTGADTTPAIVESTAEDANGEDATPEAAAGNDGGSAEAIAATLAEEIRDGRVDDDDLELLREELDGGVPNSVDVRIRRLQRTVSDLDAYTEALEEFIDENGSGEELIESFRSDVEELSDTVADIEDDIETVTEDLDSVQAEVEATQEQLDEEIDELRDHVETETDELESTVESDLDSMRDEIDRTAEEVFEETQSNSDRIATLEDQLAEFEAFRERLEQAFGGMGATGAGEAADED